MRDFRFPREVGENCVLLGYYAASSGNSLQTILDFWRWGGEVIPKLRWGFTTTRCVIAQESAVLFCILEVGRQSSLVLGKWPTWRTNSFLYIYSNSLHVSNNLVLIIRRVICINTTSGICHSVSVTVSCAGRQNAH